MSDIESHLSERAVEYAEEHIGKDIQMGAMAVPPIPRKRVKEYAEDDADLRGHLYDLTDIALAINHSGDPVLDGSVGDEEPYNVTADTRAEIKVARGALFSSFNRELRAVADRLGIDDTEDDLVTAIRDELDYEVNVEHDEDWSTADGDDLDEALGLTDDDE